MIYKPESAEFEVDYQLIDGEGCHPQRLTLLSETDAATQVEEAYHRMSKLVLETRDPRTIHLGSGAILYIGFDAEWTERTPGQLSAISYQFYVSGIGGDLSAVFFPRPGDRDDRLGMQEMLACVIDITLSTGVIIEYPEKIEQEGFFVRSDLAMCKDLPLYRHQLNNIGGKFATARSPIDFPVMYRARDLDRIEKGKAITARWRELRFVLPVRFIDVAKHAPERANLASLGDLIGLEKEKLPAGYTKDRLDLLKIGSYADFLAYGIRDAEIAVKYWLKIVEFAQEQAGCDTPPVSAGALAVQMCRQTFEKAGYDYASLFGVEEVTRTEWDPLRQRRRTHKLMIPDGERRFHEQFAIACFHGGRNESYMAGPTSVGRWYDYDLKGAYTTGLALLRPINYAASFESRKIDDFLGDVMGFLWVDFSYGPDIRFGALPVRTAERGLYYPRSGRSYCTAAELALAIRQGADVSIRRAVNYPWLDPEGLRLFLPFVRRIKGLRDKYEAEGQPLFEEYAKLLGNSVYGKTAQALRGSNAFDLEALESRKISPSLLSNGPMAAFVTGFVRAVMGEMLHAIPAHRQVVSCTTDGILCDVPADELNLDGELCRRFLDLVQRVECKEVVS